VPASLASNRFFQAAIEQAPALGAGVVAAGGGAAAGGGGGGAAPALALHPIACIRHVFLEPIAPGEPLGIVFRYVQSGGGSSGSGEGAAAAEGEAGASEAAAAAAGVGHVVVDGFQLVPALPSSTLPERTGAASVATISRAEESDLVRPGDILLGVSGVPSLGMDTAAVTRALSAAAGVTLGGAVILHLGDAPLPLEALEEATIQMGAAAAQLLGGIGPAENAAEAIVRELTLAYAEASTVGGSADEAMTGAGANI
jgi:hypothetical protein